MKGFTNQIRRGIRMVLASDNKTLEQVTNAEKDADILRFMIGSPDKKDEDVYLDRLVSWCESSLHQSFVTIINLGDIL